MSGHPPHHKGVCRPMKSSPDLIISNVKTPDGSHVNVWVTAGVIEAIKPYDPQVLSSVHHDRRLIDGGGGLISSPFVDAHFHLDATLSARPRQPAAPSTTR